VTNEVFYLPTLGGHAKSYTPQIHFFTIMAWYV